jgi:superfamily II DNA or RNA helicase
MAEIYTHLILDKAEIDVEKVKKELTLQNKLADFARSMGHQLRGPEFLELFEDLGDRIAVPRNYRPAGLRAAIEDSRPEPKERPEITFYGKLRPDQSGAATTLMKGGWRRDKFLCLAPGRGKTALALWYAAQLKLKTLVIVDQDFLLVQWQKRIEQFLRIPRERVGRIQGQTHTIGEEITIAMLPTLRNRELSSEFTEQFGLVVADEAHVLGALEAQKVLPSFPGARLILTATPGRKDGFENVFLLHSCGEVHVDLDRAQSSLWVFVNLPELLSREQLDEYIDVGAGKRRRKARLRDVLYRRVPGLRNPVLQRPLYETAAGKSEEFNMQILTEVANAAKRGRNVLVLGSRVEQLLYLAHACCAAGIDASPVVGKISDEDREIGFRSQVIFATWQIAGKALDIDRLDTLILLYPTKDPLFLRQAAGRIDRVLEGKKRTVVVTYIHTAHGTFEKAKDEMLEIIPKIDKAAEIVLTERTCLTSQR